MQFVDQKAQSFLKSLILPSLAVVALFIVFAVTNGGIHGVFAVNIIKENTVIIDPGHGGIDGGASSSTGILEKDLNLSFSLELYEMLKQSGYNAIMTRETDISLHESKYDTSSVRERKRSDLRTRHGIFNSNKNALVISIHMNKFPQSSVRGTQVFYSPTHQDSKIIAEKIQNTIKDRLQPDNKKVITTIPDSVFIFKDVSNPAVLIECGFLSNEGDLKSLSDTAYQKSFAEAVKSVVDEYYNGQ